MHSIRFSNVVLAVIVFLVLALGAYAQGFGSTDFIVADPLGNKIVVFDQNLVFQRNLDTTINAPWGLGFLPNGNLVAVGRDDTPGVGRIRVYSPSGAIVSDFTSPNIGNPVDIKASPLSNIYCPRDSAAANDAIAQFTSGGTFNGSFGTGNFFSEAILPGNILWAGGNTSTVTTFDLTTNTMSGTIPLDSGQVRVDTMYYSSATSSVLMLGGPGFDTVYERDLSGALIRQFTTPSGEFVNFGVTKGPGGDVYATVLLGTQKIHRWTSTGVFVGSTDVSASITGGANIVWAGNFTTTAAGVQVSGTVVDGSGRGIPNAVVKMSDQRGNTRNALTSPFGYFAFDDVAVGATYIIDVTNKRYQFASQVVSVNNDLSNLVFAPWTPSLKETKSTFLMKK